MTVALAILPLSTTAAVVVPAALEDPIAKLVAAGLSIAVTIGVLVKLLWELQREKRELLAIEREEKKALAESLEKSRQDLVSLHRETITMGYKTASAAESASDAAKEVSQLVRDLRHSREQGVPRFAGNVDGS